MSKSIAKKVVGANFADADTFKDVVAKGVNEGATCASGCRIGKEDGKA